MAETKEDPGLSVRSLIRGASKGALATLMADGAPYASLVEIACGQDGTPILLLSDLAQHSMNLKENGRASLLIEEQNAAGETPLASSRVTLTGKADVADDPLLKARYLARHPHAEDYAALGDFRFYRFEIDWAHLVAGFGKIAWVDAGDVLFGDPTFVALRDAEAGIVGHMNEDHLDAIELYATRLAGMAEGPWRMTGIDPEGFDIACDAGRARLDFESPIATADEARKALVKLVAEARSAQGA